MSEKNMENPLVSIIVPVYNCEKYVKQCLDSIMGQSYANIEVIVINDGSTDGSEAILQEMVVGNTKLAVITQVNRGVSSARNYGVELARGKYITFIDGDDYVEENYIKNFVVAAEENKAELCVCGYTKVTEKGKELLKVIPSTYQKNEREEFPYRVLATLSRFYQLDFWRKHHIRYMGERQVRGEDIPIALLTNALAENIQCVKQTGYYYVQYSISARNTMQGLKNHTLPYEALEQCIQYVCATEKTNNKQFFELGVFRTFTTFFFDIARGAERGKIEELYVFANRMIENYFKQYGKNDKLNIFAGLCVPFTQKVAVKIFVILYKLRLLYFVGRLLGK